MSVVLFALQTLAVFLLKQRQILFIVVIFVIAIFYTEWREIVHLDFRYLALIKTKKIDSTLFFKHNSSIKITFNQKQFIVN